jgi:hypothetical protein
MGWDSLLGRLVQVGLDTLYVLGLFRQLAQSF